jgi:protein TonB
LKYLGEHIKYPAFAQENGIQGRVTLSFTVEKDGSIANIEVMRSPADELSKEAVRVVSSMPKWKPGKQRGKPVRVKYVLPVVFRLN